LPEEIPQNFCVKKKFFPTHNIETTKMSTPSPFSKVEDVIAHFKAGGIVMVSDDESRENECDLIMAAEFATPEKLLPFIRYGTGLVCVTMEADRATRLGLPQMVKHNQDKMGTAFTLTIDAADAGTGVSAENRVRTILAVANDTIEPSHIKTPGHILGLVSRHGGTLVRRGHTESATDLCILAGLKRVGVICELQRNDTDGEMMLLPECIEMSKKFGYPLITVEDLSRAMKSYYETRPEELVEPEVSKKYWADNTMADVKLAVSSPIQLKLSGIESADWTLDTYTDADGDYHVLLKYKELDLSKPVLTRIHSECFTGDILHSLRCDCGDQLKASAKIIEQNGSGAILYLRKHEGRAIGFVNKMKAYVLQQKDGLNTYEANQALGFDDDLRDYTVARKILDLAGIKKINMLTNNPDKIKEFADYVVEIVPMDIVPNKFNENYLEVKKHVVPPTIPSKEPPITLEWMKKKVDPSNLKIAIIKTAWNATLINEFVGNLLPVFERHGAKSIDQYEVSGCFEIPMLAKRLADKYDVFLAVGILFKGETMHFESVLNAAVNGIVNVQLETGVPIVDAILPCYKVEQAVDRVSKQSLEVNSLPLTVIAQGLVKQGFCPKV
jgi:3,4-dihydroxy 2-butanone 4-phosphate synthase/GTP cyclohydrolase II